MSNVKSWGKFLSGLNAVGKTGKVIKTVPDFAPDTDPELVKFNIAIASAKKNGYYVITRKSKNDDYETSESSELSPFLNNDYIGVLTTKFGDVFISEFKKVSSREYVDATEYKPIDEVTKLEPIEVSEEKEFKAFNKALKAAAKFQCIVKDKNGYSSENKGIDTLKKFIKYRYFGFFSKKPNFLEYIRIGYRKVVDGIEQPVIYGGKDNSNKDGIIGDFLKIETKIAEEPKKDKVKKNKVNTNKTFKDIMAFFIKDALGYIRRANKKSGYEYNYEGGYLFKKPTNFPTKMIDGFLNNEYNAIVTGDKIYEFYRFNVRPITQKYMDIDPIVIERLKENSVWEGEKYEVKNFNEQLDKSIAMIRSKNGFEGASLGKDQTSFIKRLVNEEIEYFCIKSTSEKLYEFIRFDVRERKSKLEPTLYNQ